MAESAPFAAKDLVDVGGFVVIVQLPDVGLRQRLPKSSPRQTKEPIEGDSREKRGRFLRTRKPLRHLVFLVIGVILLFLLFVVGCRRFAGRRRRFGEAMTEELHDGERVKDEEENRLDFGRSLIN